MVLAREAVLDAVLPGSGAALEGAVDAVLPWRRRRPA